MQLAHVMRTPPLGEENEEEEKRKKLRRHKTNIGSGLECVGLLLVVNLRPASYVCRSVCTM